MRFRTGQSSVQKFPRGFLAPAIGLIAGLCLILPGCGGSSGPTRIRVKGIVEHKAADLVNGTITFLPAKGHNGPAANGSILNGKFEIPAEEGPTAGAHQVLINLTPTKMGESAVGAARKKSTQMRWEFNEEISPQHADFDFILQEE